MKQPVVNKEFETISQEPKARHEEMVELFGRYYFWLRSAVRERTRELLSSSKARERLSNAFRAPYENAAAKLSEEQQNAALDLANASVDEFARLFLSMLSATGISHRIGKNHAIRFRLDMEVCDVEGGTVVMNETINRGGRKHFADYWGKWLLAYSKEVVTEEEREIV